MKRNAASPPVVLHFWDMLARLSSTHASVEAAVEEAYALTVRHPVILDRITTADGAVLMDEDTLADAVVRYREGLPMQGAGC